MRNSRVTATNVGNTASGFLSSARQEIGGAANGGVLNNVTVLATNSNNSASGFLSSSTQRIGVAR